MENESSDEEFRGYVGKSNSTLVEAPKKVGGTTNDLHRKKCECLVGTMRRILLFAESHVTAEKEKISVRSKVLEEAWASFNALQLEICDSKLYEEVECVYFEAAEKLEKLAYANVCVLQEPVNSSERKPVQLPKLTIPTFSGAYETWTSFHDMFLEVVHKNSALSNTEKGFYLKSFLKGEPLTIVQAFPISDKGYEVAWSALEERYKNKYIIKKKHVDELMCFRRRKFPTWRELEH
uniref:Uncharacterized protein n=1 Tax=Anopheles coluzzii TaxID=1518534 RepID=A0A8W7P222_ANOCL